MPTITAASPTSISNSLYMRVNLFQHQERVLEAAICLERNSTFPVTDQHIFVSNVGFICCAPGAGKSIVVLALATQTSPTRTNRPINMSFSSGSMLQTTRSTVLSTLIVVPDCLIDQWEEYVTRFTYCSAPEFAVLTKKAHLTQFSFTNQKIVVCSPEVYKIVSVQYHFHRIVFDEVDTINIPACTQPSANMIWCLSSNVSKLKTADVVNRGFLKKMLLEIKQVSEYYNYDLWHHLMIQTDPDYLLQSINIPTYTIQKKQYLPPIEPLSVETCELYFANGLMPKVGEYYGLATFDDWDAFTEKMMADKIAAVRTREAQYSTAIQSVNCIRDKLLFMQENQQYMTDVSQLLDEMSNISDRLSAVECPITCAPITFAAGTKCCFNKFEASSLLFAAARMGSCPMCRSPLSGEDIVLFSPHAFHPATPTVTSKEDLFKHIILSNYNGGRTLIFAGPEYPVAKRILEDIGVMFAEFTGRVINRCISKFSSGEPPILMMDYTKFSTGFNLTAATHLIIFEDTVDPVGLQQMIGRAQRIGRQTPLNVIQFTMVSAQHV